MIDPKLLKELSAAKRALECAEIKRDQTLTDHREATRLLGEARDRHAAALQALEQAA